MATSYSEYFIGLPLSQIEVKNFHSRYILQDLYEMIRDYEQSGDEYYLSKIYTINPHSYVHLNKHSLHSDTIKFIEWIQANKDDLEKEAFKLSTSYNGNGDNAYIFGTYLRLGFSGDPYYACRVNFDRVDIAKTKLARFSELLETLEPTILEHLKNDNLISVWSNVHST